MKHVNLFFVVLLISFPVLLHSQTDEAPFFAKDIKSAEKLLDLKFTDIERDSMFEDLKDQLVNFQNIHKIHLDNNRE